MKVCLKKLFLGRKFNRVIRDRNNKLKIKFKEIEFIYCTKNKDILLYLRRKDKLTQSFFDLVTLIARENVYGLEVILRRKWYRITIFPIIFREGFHYHFTS